jgi:hypothetical protein
MKTCEGSGCQGMSRSVALEVRVVLCFRLGVLVRVGRGWVMCDALVYYNMHSCDVKHIAGACSFLRRPGLRLFRRTGC